MRLTFLLCGLIVLLTGRPTLAAEGAGIDDEITLRSAGLPSDGPGLLAFFKSRTATHVEEEKLNKLIEALGAQDEAARSKAFQELAGLGPLAVPALRAVVNDPDSGTASTLARQCLEVIQGERGSQLFLLASRVLSQHRPEGAAQALLACVPLLDSDELHDEFKRALGEVGFDKEGKPEPALLKALSDEQAVRRAVAAEVLGSRGAEPREALRKLLADPKASVRLRAAVALAQAKEPKAVATLIALLAELPPNLTRDAEDYLANLAAEQAPKLEAGMEAPARQKLRQAWADWWDKTEGAAPLDEIKKRTMTDERREQAMSLIKKLGAEDFKVRIAAQDDLKKMGVVVVPLLRKAIKDETDVELKEKAKECLVAIEKVAPGSLSPVFPRVVAFRKPAGAAEALLDFLPFADEDAVLAEVQGALNALAYQDGKPAPALVEALKHKLPQRRAAAAEALAVAGSKELDNVRKLLKDADATVKLRAAIALARAYDADAVPLLIELSSDLTPEQAGPLEEFLARLAGDDAPAGQPGTDAATRIKRREAWAAWWKEKGSKASLGAMLSRPEQERYLGYTLAVSPSHAKVMEIGSDGRTRWEIAGMPQVWDMQMISRNRVLILETGSNRVTERNLRGDVLWEMRYTLPDGNPYYGMQRLPNGNILLVGNTRIVEKTRAGKDVFTFHRPNGDMYQARKLRDGSIVFVTSSSTAHRIDAKGAEIKTFRLNNPTTYGIHILPNGNIVYPQQHANRVWEHDTNGQQVWTATVTQPMSVYRLANGNTLVGCGSPLQAVELDRAGKEVWKAALPIQPFRVYRR